MIADKCCSYTDNTSPTMAQIKAIEVTWNTFINSYFTAIDEKYPSTDLTIISEATGTLLRNTDGTSKKNSNNQPMFRVETDDGDMVELAREEINALRLKSHTWNTVDDEISHNASLIVDKMGMMLGVSIGGMKISDETIPDPDDASKTQVSPGITTLLLQNKVTLRTHLGHFKFGDYKKEELIFTEG